MFTSAAFRNRKSSSMVQVESPAREPMAGDGCYGGGDGGGAADGCCQKK